MAAQPARAIRARVDILGMRMSRFSAIDRISARSPTDEEVDTVQLTTDAREDRGTAPDRRSRAIVLGASHWHVPLYVDAILRRHRVLGVQDAAPEAAHGAWGVPVTTDVGALLDLPGVDVAYVLSPHDEMAAICHALVERGIPFAVEKPAAMDAAQLSGLMGAAREAGVPATVALVQRDAPIERWLRQVGEVAYERLSFIAGPPDRYLRNGNPWMLDPARAGGGALVNLGPHFIDLTLRHLGPDLVSTVRRSSALHHRSIEDHATVVLSTADGRESIVEVGYAFPSAPQQRYCSFTAAGSLGYASVDTDGTAQFTDLGGTTVTERIVVDSDPLYAVFVDAVADSLDAGFAGMSTLQDLARAMHPIWAQAPTPPPHSKEPLA